MSKIQKSVTELNTNFPYHLQEDMDASISVSADMGYGYSSI